ncbi:MAG: ribonuclease HII, partial [Actinobacteria bacterium]|nr:ribonuclease HII [Actinomycetota bacterium]
WEGIRDSKELSPSQREEQFSIIASGAIEYSIIEISADDIDSLGLHRANLEGMRRAVLSIAGEIDYVLTDGYAVSGLSIPNLAVVKGDQVALSISAASILAKVHRDRLMVELDGKYPGYGLADHKGYVTKIHQAAMEKLGVSEIHRRSYANVAAIINSQN